MSNETLPNVEQFINPETGEEVIVYYGEYVEQYINPEDGEEVLVVLN